MEYRWCPDCEQDLKLELFRVRKHGGKPRRVNICKKCEAIRYRPMDNCPECSGMKTIKAPRCRSCSARLQGNKNWKGGKVESKGYYKLYSGNGRYDFEHRLVMEEKLGRKLRENENVHHVNGNKKDNRPENLELWVKSQPPGQRAKDLVLWAKEIIKLYGNEIICT